jgi:hypothetical protein
LFAIQRTTQPSQLPHQTEHWCRRSPKTGRR